MDSETASALARGAKYARARAVGVDLEALGTELLIEGAALLNNVIGRQATSETLAGLARHLESANGR